jgi:hypothetical protein
MNRAARSLAHVLSLAASAAILLRCGPLTGSSLAGGSGAGNPGGTVALSMRANGDPAAKASAPAEGKIFNVIGGCKPIVIADKAGLEFTITSVSLKSLAISFVLDGSQEPGQLLASMRERRPELSCDSNSIILSGSHQFNVLKGDADSLTSALPLPVARYTGLSMHFGAEADDNGGVQSGQLAMSGTFLYNGSLHAITIDIDHPLWQFYRFAGGIFTLSNGDTTHLELRFDATHWFAAINFAQDISLGLFAFDSSGVLTLSNSAGRSLAPEIELLLANNFIESGKLAVY